MKKQISLLTLSVAIAASMGVSAYAAPSTTEVGQTQVAATSSPVLRTFSDTGNHWGKAAIEWALSQGIVDGYEDGSFQPDRTLTRAEFVKLAVTALKLSVTGTTSGAEWYKPYVAAAEKAGFSESFSDWNQPMSRSEMAKMAVRATVVKNEDELKWLYLATKAGLIQGVDDTGTLDEGGTTTRAQSVTIIQRLLSVKAGETLPADKHAVSRAEVLWHKTNIESMLDDDYIDVAATPEQNRFDSSKLYAEADNGNVKGWADGLFVVDLDDPNDPYKTLLDRAYAWYNDQNQPLPSGAYALISVNNVEVKINTYNLKRFNNASYLGFYESFDYGTKERFTDGKLMSSMPMVFYFQDGDRERPEGTTIIENVVYTSRHGQLLPKLPGITRNRNKLFQINFRSFGDFGDLPVHYFNYALPASRKAGA